jgi:hypothetical protein
VCFINLNSDSFLRNRDVCSMFRRWSQLSATDKLTNKLPYETFLGFVTK